MLWPSLARAVQTVTLTALLLAGGALASSARQSPSPVAAGPAPSAAPADDLYGTAPDRARLQQLAQRGFRGGGGGGGFRGGGGFNAPRYNYPRPNPNYNYPRAAPQQALPQPPQIRQQPFAPLTRQAQPWMSPRTLLPRAVPPAVTSYRYALPGISRTIRVTVRDPRTGQIRTTIYRPRLATRVGNSVRRVALVPKIAINGVSRRARDAAQTRRLAAFAGAAALASMSSGVAQAHGANRPAHDDGHRSPDQGVRRSGNGGGLAGDGTSSSGGAKFLVAAMGKGVLVGSWQSNNLKAGIQGAVGNDRKAALLANGSVRTAAMQLAFRAAAIQNAANQNTFKSTDSDATIRHLLISELNTKGIKHTRENIVDIRRDSNGKVVFLETGNEAAGLKHILLRHETDFIRAGYTSHEIADVVMKAVTEGRIVGSTGARPVYEFTHNGKAHRMAVTVSSNGFVVGANPISSTWEPR